MHRQLLQICVTGILDLTLHPTTDVGSALEAGSVLQYRNRTDDGIYRNIMESSS